MLTQNEILLLSRGGRVPRLERSGSGVRPPPCPPRRPGLRRRLSELNARLATRRPRAQDPRLDIHDYLELEFAIKDEPR